MGTLVVAGRSGGINMRGYIHSGFVGVRLVVIGLAALWGMSRAMATESLAAIGGTAEIEARIAALEGRIAELDDESTKIRAHGVSYLPDSDDASCCDPCRPSVGRDFLSGRCRTAGYYGGAEIMWLKPFSSGITPLLVDGSSANEFLPGWRLWGGYQNCDGLGWRVNWWQWDQSSTGVSDTFFGPTAIVDTRLVFQKLDLLATQMVSFRSWDLMLLGGVTYAGNQFNGGFADPAGPDFITGSARFDGWGLTTGLMAYRDIPWLSGLTGYGGVQWSGIYGNSVLAETSVFDSSRLALNGTLLNVLEMKVGTQYERRIGRGAIGFVSAGFEAQYWAGLANAPVFGFFDNRSSLGLVGFTVGTGIRR